MKVNGKRVDFKKGENLKEFLENNKYKIQNIAVECNGNVILKNDYEKHILSDKNTYEIVSFVGGG
ncbi:MAG: sulfur carrier protein ThiS [Methanobrevibacter sp.]|jgi:thiamine biosynthesis protein ThiS|nr:sulfur carrier protein ThiS [Methanobrevibacter sp.]